MLSYRARDFSPAAGRNFVQSDFSTFNYQRPGVPSAGFACQLPRLVVTDFYFVGLPAVYIAKLALVLFPVNLLWALLIHHADWAEPKIFMLIPDFTRYFLALLLIGMKMDGHEVQRFPDGRPSRQRTCLTHERPAMIAGL
jgi:hypothetical protein